MIQSLKRLLEFFDYFFPFLEHVIHQFPQGRVFCIQSFELLLGKLARLHLFFQSGKADGLSVHQRLDIRLDERPHLDLNQGETFLFHLVVEFLQNGFLPILGLLHQLVSSLLISLAFEHCGDVLLQREDEVLHVASEHLALASWQAYDSGHVGIFEVVNVAFVIRTLFLLLQFFQKKLDGGQSSSAHKAGHEDVVANAFDIQAQFDGLHRPILPDDPVAGLHVVGGDKIQILRVTSPT